MKSLKNRTLFTKTLLRVLGCMYLTTDTSTATLVALWRVKHTTDSLKAKPWVKPTNISDMYLKDECIVWTDGTIKKCILDAGTIYSPEEYAAGWENIEI